MLKKILNSEGVQALTKSEQKAITGGTCTNPPTGTEGVDYSYAPYLICNPELPECDTKTCSFQNIYGVLVNGTRYKVGTACDVCKVSS